MDELNLELYDKKTPEYKTLLNYFYNLRYKYLRDDPKLVYYHVLLKYFTIEFIQNNVDFEFGLKIEINKNSLLINMNKLFAIPDTHIIGKLIVQLEHFKRKHFLVNFATDIQLQFLSSTDNKQENISFNEFLCNIIVENYLKQHVPDLGINPAFDIKDITDEDTVTLETLHTKFRLKCVLNTDTFMYQNGLYFITKPIDITKNFWAVQEIAPDILHMFDNIMKSVASEVNALELIKHRLINRHISINWQKELSKIITASLAANSIKITKRRMHKIGLAKNLLLKGRKIENQKNIYVAIDSSGSISKKTYSLVINHLLDILHQRNIKLTVLFFDKTVYKKLIFNGYNDNVLNNLVYSGGETAFKPVFDEVAKDKSHVDLLIMFTDGQAEIVTKKQTHNLKILWVLNQNYYKFQNYIGKKIICSD